MSRNEDYEGFGVVAAAVKPWDLVTTPEGVVGFAKPGNLSTLMDEFGTVNLSNLQDATSTRDVDSLGPFFQQTSSAVDATAASYIKSASGFVGTDEDLPWFTDKFKVDRVTDMNFAIGFQSVQSAVALQTFDAPGTFAFVGAWTTEGHTNIQVLMKNTAIDVTDTGIALSKLLTGIIPLVRYTAAGVVQVTIIDAVGGAVLYDVEHTTQVPTDPDLSTWAIGASPQNGGGAILLNHYRMTHGTSL